MGMLGLEVEKTVGRLLQRSRRETRTWTNHENERDGRENNTNVKEGVENECLQCIWCPVSHQV